jgi:hypothetical protein
MSAPDRSPAAFPVSDIGVHGHYGMSLRDYFAGQVLAAFAALSGHHGLDWQRVTKEAYRAADWMLKHRQEEENNAG